MKFLHELGRPQEILQVDSWNAGLDLEVCSDVVLP